MSACNKVQKGMACVVSWKKTTLKKNPVSMVESQGTGNEMYSF